LLLTPALLLSLSLFSCPHVTIRPPEAVGPWVSFRPRALPLPPLVARSPPSVWPGIDCEVEHHFRHRRPSQPRPPFFPSAHGSNTPSWPAPIPPYGRIVRRFSPHRTLRLAIALPLTSVTKGSRRPLVPQQNLIRMRCRQLFFFLRHTSPPLPPPLLPPFFVLFSCPEWACTGFVSLHSLPADPSCLAKGPRRSQSGRECPPVRPTAPPSER